jgi:hypothetical protein
LDCTSPHPSGYQRIAGADPRISGTNSPYVYVWYVALLWTLLSHDNGTRASLNSWLELRCGVCDWGDTFPARCQFWECHFHSWDHEARGTRLVCSRLLPYVSHLSVILLTRTLIVNLLLTS